ncbi:probable uridine nucleosidase 2 isoform X2 [Aphidius gifuensis]|uniref:probable uridine nucleosidase 2 isoform X2 n=1 Tax=Aphidius gifuensis TaxID=684658 RepID=UPI001CDCC0D7|nr:probable uridine nucleosidase 2 isoform X2 [Aphidius gifuensis]
MLSKKKLSFFAIIIVMTTSLGINADKLVIDTDAGADDAISILLVLSAYANNDTDFDLVGITCTYGNTYLTNVENNVLKILTIANASKIPVYSGAHKPLINNYTSDNFFGEDGFGDFQFNEKITTEIDRSKHSAIALIKLAKKYAGKISILVLGPTTNIALAISMDPKFVDNVKRFYVMGGSVGGIGNVRPGVEFNFGMDPASNFIFLNSTRGKINLLLPWETVLSLNISMSWRRDELGSIDSKFIKFLNLAESKIKETPFYNPADPLAAAVMLWPNLIKKSLVKNVTPIINGEARGGLLTDYSDLTTKLKNVEIVQEVNVEEFKKMLIFYLS